MPEAQLEAWFTIVWTLIQGDPDDMVPADIESQIGEVVLWLDTNMLRCCRGDRHMAETCFQLWALAMSYQATSRTLSQKITAVDLTPNSMALLASKPHALEWFNADERFCEIAPRCYQQGDTPLYVVNADGRNYLFARLHRVRVGQELAGYPRQLSLDSPPVLNATHLHRLSQHWWPLLHQTMEKRVDYAYVSSHVDLLDVYSQPLCDNEFRLINQSLKLTLANQRELNGAVFEHDVSAYYEPSRPENIYGLWIGFIAHVCDGMYKNATLAWLTDDEALLDCYRGQPYIFLTSCTQDHSQLLYLRRGMVRHQSAFTTPMVLRCLGLLLTDLCQDPAIGHEQIDELACFLLRDTPLSPQSSLFGLL